MNTAAAMRAGATRRKKFLEALAQSGNVSRSAKAAGADRRTVYQWRNADPAFAAAWDDALEECADTLEEELRDLGQRANNPTAYIFLLKGLRPEKYRENVNTRQEVSGEQRIVIEFKRDWRGGGEARVVESGSEDGDGTRRIEAPGALPPGDARGPGAGL